jgi:uncharacterized iron-regulated protein
MKHLTSFLILTAIALTTNSQSLRPYVIYNSTGNEVTYEDMVKTALEAELVFFGELHNNPIAHWMQLKMLKSFKEKTSRQLMVGAEMFETDNQLLINEYLGGIIPEKNFEDEAKLWNNYKTDYKPLILFAKQNNIPVIATNTPRRYAAMVNRGGFETLDTLSDEAKKLIAPLPFPYNPELPGYKAMTEMPVMHGPKRNMENLPKAQALKDATMAHFILKNHKDRGLFYHLNGSYHTQNNEGILWYIQQQLKGIKMVTITTISVENVHSVKPEELKTANFTICVDGEMTNTY